MEKTYISEFPFNEEEKKMSKKTNATTNAEDHHKILCNTTDKMIDPSWNVKVEKKSIKPGGCWGYYTCLLLIEEEFIATGSSDGMVRIIEKDSMEEIQRLVGHNDWVLCLSFFKGKEVSYLFSGGGLKDSSIIIWKINDFYSESGIVKLYRFTSSHRSVCKLSASLSNKKNYLSLISVGSNEIISCWNFFIDSKGEIANKYLKSNLIFADEKFYALTFLLDEKFFAVAGNLSAIYIIQIIRKREAVFTKKIKCLTKAHSACIWTLVSSKIYSNLLFSAGKDGVIKAWNYFTSENLLTLPANDFSLQTPWNYSLGICEQVFNPGAGGDALPKKIIKKFEELNLNLFSICSSRVSCFFTIFRISEGNSEVCSKKNLKTCFEWVPWEGLQIDAPNIEKGYLTLYSPTSVGNNYRGEIFQIKVSPPE